jgi:hypothetical protein
MSGEPMRCSARLSVVPGEAVGPAAQQHEDDRKQDGGEGEREAGQSAGICACRSGWAVYEVGVFFDELIAQRAVGGDAKAGRDPQGVDRAGKDGGGDADQQSVQDGAADVGLKDDDRGHGGRMRRDEGMHDGETGEHGDGDQNE